MSFAPLCITPTSPPAAPPLLVTEEAFVVLSVSAFTVSSAFSPIVPQSSPTLPWE